MSINMSRGDMQEAEINIGWSMKRLARSEGHRPSIRQTGTHIDHAAWFRDQQVLTWLREQAERVPTSKCAEALGMSRTSAKSSLMRLRSRSRVQFERHGRSYLWSAV